MKHLSTGRKRYSVSSGERKRIRPNHTRVKLSGVARVGLWDLLDLTDMGSGSKKVALIVEWH